MTCNPNTENTPPPPLRGAGGLLCALLPTAAGAAVGSARHHWRQRASLRLLRGAPRRGSPPRSFRVAAAPLYSLAAANCRSALRRASACGRHIAASAGAQRLPPRHRRCAERNAGHQRRASAVTNVNGRSHLVTPSVYKCKLPQASRAQAADIQPSSAILVKYYEGKNVIVPSNPLE